MKHLNEGDSIVGKRLSFQGSKVTVQAPFRKSGSHRGQRGSIYNGECWIEDPIDLPKKKKKNSKKRDKK